MSRNFVKLRESLKLNKNQFAKFLGVRNGAVSTYELPDRGLGKKMIALIKEKIPNINEAFLKDVSDDMYMSDVNVEYKAKEKTIKVYGKVDAGAPTETWHNSEDNLILNYTPINRIKGQLIGFIVKGESMENKFADGDTVFATEIFLNTDILRDEDYVVVILKSGPDSSRALLKQFFWADKEKKSFMLKSSNPAYPPQFHRLKDIAKIFRVHFGITLLNKNLK